MDAMAYVELARVGSGRVIESGDVAVDIDDDDALRGLLNRMTKRNGMGAADGELRLRGGRRPRVFRI